MRKNYPLVNSFYIDDHAILFALLTQSAAALSGQFGVQAMKKAITSYGRERGLRCAKRCVADGEPLSAENYFIYNEWVDTKGWSKTEVVAVAPLYRTRVLTCGWCESWKQHGLIEYGKLYCKWVDHNLLYGFNPELTLDMGDLLSESGGYCEFNWTDLCFENEGQWQLFLKKREQAAPRVTRDFLYHCGHLLSTSRRELLIELGFTAGQAIIEKALAEYVERFSIEKLTIVEEETKQDFLLI